MTPIPECPPFYPELTSQGIPKILHGGLGFDWKRKAVPSLLFPSFFSRKQAIDFPVKNANKFTASA
jgi:hypothetical protein